MGPKVCRENIPHTITTPAANHTMQDGSMFFMPNYDPDIWMLQQKSRQIRPGNIFPVLMSLCEFIGWHKQHLVWSSAAAAKLFQTLSGWALLHVTSGCLIYCCLSGWSRVTILLCHNQSRLNHAFPCSDALSVQILVSWTYAFTKNRCT